MVSLSCRLKLNQPITSVECLFPNSFVLKFTGDAIFPVFVEFDFNVYKYRILPDGIHVDVVGVGLDTRSFPMSSKVVEFCKKYTASWADVVIHCTNNPDSGSPVKVLGVYDIVICEGDYKHFLPYYEYPAVNGKSLTAGQIKSVTKIMWDVAGFCTGYMPYESEDVVRLFERDRRVHLRISSGDGVFYDMETEEVGFVGEISRKAHSGEVQMSFLTSRVKEVIVDAITKLSSMVPFPVSSITIPINGGGEGYLCPSKIEDGAFDIVLK